MREVEFVEDDFGHYADASQKVTQGIAEVLSANRAIDRWVLALLKYPFYPLFNFDNGMNLISKSLTILTSAQLLVVFTFAHIFWRYFVFAGF